MYNILVLCTGNSARSIIGEAIINHLGKGTYRGFSAGSNPTGKINPNALSLLQDKQLPTQNLRSKSWDEYIGSHVPPMDLVVTLGSKAAGETCPVWHGAPLTAHWGLPDPAAVAGSDEDIRQAFELTYQQLNLRLNTLFDLDPANMPIGELKGLLPGLSQPDWIMF